MRRPGREEWEQLLAEFPTSGLSQKEFVAKHDVSFGTFQYWLYRKSKRRAVSAANAAASFLPIDVVASAPEARSVDALELVLHGGAVLRFPVGTDLSYLAELFRALR